MTDIKNLPPGPVSGRALARLLGVTENAVRTARTAERLRRCVVPGGYDPAIALEEWRANTDPRQQRRVTAATDTAAAADAKRRRGPEQAPPSRGKAKVRSPARPAPPTPSAAPPSAPTGPGTGEVIDLQSRLAAHRAARLAAAAPKGADAEDEPDVDGDDMRSMAQIRRDMLLVEEQVQLLDLAAKLGSVMPSVPTKAGVQTLAREFRDATLRLPDQYGAQIAAELGVDRHDCHEVLDRYCRLLFETAIAVIDVMKIFDDGEDADGPA